MTQSFHTNPSFQLLLATTEEIIRERGCSQTTLQEIIKRTGLSKGAIYHYVQSKDELFALVLQSKLEQVNENFALQVSKSARGDLQTPLRAIIKGFSQMMRAEGNVALQIFVYLLSQKEKPEIAEILRRFYEFSVTLQTKWIETGQEGGAISKALDARKTAQYLVAHMFGSGILGIIQQGERPLDEEDILQILMRILRD
ncbi:TetR/AcrR family transcriptional regulator [Brevibacillus sp. B_LB10_24]|uniref:TetR/AcrR family transcriptional regulator n=1 Tax=Brevibacillus sp. B_LB10_24 TaxID=3380645 RepID=UPI0038B6D534